VGRRSTCKKVGGTHDPGVLKRADVVSAKAETRGRVYQIER
jgi:hypothetical protein